MSAAACRAVASSGERRDRAAAGGLAPCRTRNGVAIGPDVDQGTTVRLRAR
jgi:hypothetical protein